MTAALPKFKRTEIDDILKKTLPNSVAVVVAPPGQGKSTHTRAAIADYLRAGSLSRVLWCVQGIHGTGSLGEEAWQDFSAAGIKASIVYPAREFPKSKSGYNDQFKWSTVPEVKIISHARLPLIFKPGSTHVSAGLKSAQLLVIDEDPSGALILNNDKYQASTKLAPPQVAKVSSPEASWNALCDMADATLPADTQVFQQFNHFVRGYGLFGEPFWKNFLVRHPAPVNVSTFERVLSETGIGNDALQVAQAFADDAALAARGVYRQRFGLHWPGSKQDQLTPPAQFRFNLLEPLEFDCPVVVLDGYAHEKFYRALFPYQTVNLHLFQPAPPLDVECAPMLGINQMEHGTQRRLQQRKHIAEEMARQKKINPGQEQLCLLPKALTKEFSEMRKNFETAYQAIGLSSKDEPSFMHWYAGRGVNAHSGADVYALSIPAINSMYQHYTLSALFPDQSEERDEFKTHANAAELLQMLNRGRQQLHSKKPRIIVGASGERIVECLGELADRVSLSNYNPIGVFVKNSRNPRWFDATVALADELLEFFPNGLPKPLLEGLPTLTAKGIKAQKVGERLEGLAVNMLDPGYELYQALVTRQNWRYADVSPGGSSNDNQPLDTAMSTLGLQKVVGTGSSPTVYVPESGDAQKARADLTSFLKYGWASLPQVFEFVIDDRGYFVRPQKTD